MSKERRKECLTANIPALWARSNAAKNQNLFSKNPAGEFSKTAAIQRGWYFCGYPLCRFSNRKAIGALLEVFLFFLNL